MLSKAQEKFIRSLHTKKGRRDSGFCLVEGHKFVTAAKGFVEYVFIPDDTPNFEKLITTETPQDMAAVARIPSFSENDILSKPIILLLDGVQEPGNVGAILRLALAFHASIVLVESADPTSPKAIRSSAGAFFSAPWISIPRNDAEPFIKKVNRPIFRLEKRSDALSPSQLPQEPIVIIVGSEGKGITLDTEAPAITIAHDAALESLSVSHAVAILLSSLYHP